MHINIMSTIVENCKHILCIMVLFKLHDQLASTKGLIKIAKLVRWSQKHSVLFWDVSLTWQPSEDQYPELLFLEKYNYM